VAHAASQEARVVVKVVRVGMGVATRVVEARVEATVGLKVEPQVMVGLGVRMALGVVKARVLARVEASMAMVEVRLGMVLAGRVVEARVGARMVAKQVVRVAAMVDTAEWVNWQRCLRAAVPQTRR